jgi:hypothetical protein
MMPQACRGVLVVIRPAAIVELALMLKQILVVRSFYLWTEYHTRSVVILSSQLKCYAKITMI